MDIGVPLVAGSLLATVPSICANMSPCSLLVWEMLTLAHVASPSANPEP